MKKTNFDRYLEEQLWDPAFVRRFGSAGEAWDVTLQVAALRKQAGLSQKQLARKQHAILGSIFFLILTAGCDSPGVSSHEKTMEVTILLPADTQKYWETITGEEDFPKAAALPFVRKKVVVPNSPDLIRASADAAAREIGPTQAGPPQQLRQFLAPLLPILLRHRQQPIQHISQQAVLPVTRLSLAEAGSRCRPQ